MKQYREPGLAKAKKLDHQADAAFASGAAAGETSDKFVRTTVFLASVLFLVGISTRFAARADAIAWCVTPACSNHVGERAFHAAEVEQPAHQQEHDDED